MQQRLRQTEIEQDEAQAPSAEDAQIGRERGHVAPFPIHLEQPAARIDETEAEVIARAPAPVEEQVAPAAEAAPGPASSKKSRRKTLAIGGLVLALALGAWYGQYYWTTGRFIVSTDDAYVGAKNATLAAKITGYVASVDVDDNSEVRAGDVIARIDDGDYRLAVQTARDTIAVQETTITRIGRQVEAQQAAVEQAEAQLASSQAALTRAELELTRQKALATRDYASRQTLEQAQANRDQAIAAVQSAKAAIDAAKANVDVLKAQQDEARRTLDQNRTALAKAERDLSFTVIRAPFDGFIGNRAVQTGDYVQPGQRLASLVPLDAVYIDANFKETQLKRLSPGQPVSISVDALPDREIAGTVVSVAPASGSVFSLLPPDNATGNFTKIVQRVPVRIRVPVRVTEEKVLRPGLSVVVSVNTKNETTKAADAGSGVASGKN